MNRRQGDPTCIHLRNKQQKKKQAEKKNGLLKLYWMIIVLLGRLKEQPEARATPRVPTTIPESPGEKPTSDPNKSGLSKCLA